MWIAVAAIGGALVAGVASNMAADTQADAANQANATQWDMYKQSRQDQLPWLQAGQEALGKLPGMIEQGPGDFQASPNYQFVQEEGNRGIDRAMAARGLYGSGKAIKDLTRFNTGLAGNEYQNFVNNWIQTKLNPTQSLGNVGQTSAQGLGNQSMNNAAMIGGNLQAAGQARASGYINKANAVTGGLQGFSDFYAMNNANQQQQPVQPYSQVNNGTGWQGLGEGQYGSMY